jgi:hypothetical protein
MKGNMHAKHELRKPAYGMGLIGSQPTFNPVSHRMRACVFGSMA